MVFPKLHVDSSACVTIEASPLTSGRETWQLLRKENDIVLICLSGDGGILSIHFYAVFVYMYEGCPSKSWTFFITRDFVSGIL